jgi:hypothetical protein
VARLLLNKAFFDSGYPMLNISKETQGYFDALIKSVEKGDEKPFVKFVFGRFVGRLRGFRRDAAEDPPVSPARREMHGREPAREAGTRRACAPEEI